MSTRSGCYRTLSLAPNVASSLLILDIDYNKMTSKVGGYNVRRMMVPHWSFSVSYQKKMMSLPWTRGHLEWVMGFFSLSLLAKWIVGIRLWKLKLLLFLVLSTIVDGWVYQTPPSLYLYYTFSSLNGKTLFPFQGTVIIIHAWTDTTWVII